MRCIVIFAIVEKKKDSERYILFHYQNVLKTYKTSDYCRIKI